MKATVQPRRGATSIRAELSLANGIDRRGHVSERIILPTLRTDERS